jgi:hypothetical protein
VAGKLPRGTGAWTNACTWREQRGEHARRVAAPWWEDTTGSSGVVAGASGNNRTARPTQPEEGNGDPCGTGRSARWRTCRWGRLWWLAWWWGAPWRGRRGDGWCVGGLWWTMMVCRCVFSGIVCRCVFSGMACRCVNCGRIYSRCEKRLITRALFIGAINGGKIVYYRK